MKKAMPLLMANAISKFDAIDQLVNEYAPDQIELALSL